MKKQLTMALGILTLSALLVGCSEKTNEASTTLEQNTITTETVTPEENQVEVTEDTLETDAAEAIDEESKEESKEEESVEETTSPDTEVTTDTKTEETTKKEEEVVVKPTESPSTSTNSTSKPQTSTQSTTTTKPQASTKPTATTKPQASTKPTTTPQASTKPTEKPQASTKPEATPSTKPETTPSPVPSTKPETTPSPDTEKPSDANTTTLSCSSIFDQITSGLDMSKQQTMDATLLTDFYGLDTSLLEDYCVKMPLMSFSITEIGVFKVKDVNNVDQVVSSINKRASDVGIMLYPSLEETYANRQVVTKGQYILFVISDDVDTIVANFNALV